MRTQALIELRGVGVDFPIYNAASVSLKNRLLSSVTGGAIDREHDGFVVVRGLQEINLRITAGERVGLIGHNGAGKTTMLRVLSGIYSPTQGEAVIQGDCVSLIDISLGIDPEATGRENIRLRSAMLGFTPEQTRERMDEIIDFSGLGDFIEMPFRTYSTGMQLRLAFAVSTTVSPQILIMDEWLSTGDENFRERAEQRMRRVVDSTDILILASHTRKLLETNCDRIIWLEHGRIRAAGATSEILDQYFGPPRAPKAELSTKHDATSS
jgi:lipopolysaccharide transport system ATP-binding protein